MDRKSFTDSITDEVLAKMIDDTLNFKKTAKNRNMKSSLLKIIPAAAMIALVIGLLNLLPHLMDITDRVNTPNSNLNGLVAASENNLAAAEPVDQSGLFLPEAIEKSFFEDRILAAITDQRAISKLNIYYCLDGSVYVLDPNANAREKKELLECVREYTDLTGGEMMQMCESYGIPLPKSIDPAYAHVRFGDTENTLLLDIEWHTYDTYMEEIVEPLRSWNDQLEGFEKQASEIKNGLFYQARTINGKSAQTWPIASEPILLWDNGNPINIAKYLDSDGYYIYNVFPIFYRRVDYIDENHEGNSKSFTYGTDACGNFVGINSQSEYEYVLKNKIIPFCDDLLAKGLIRQQEYDEFTPPNLLDYYIDIFFN
jgi:hypothetical protein